MTAHVLRADSRRLPLADNTVDLVVTSPPYFGLRSYQDGGQHYAGQVGDEATPAEFIDALLAVTAECVRVLKSSGSIWVNLGDKYSTYESRPGKAATHEWAQKSQQAERYTRSAPDAYGIPYKSLMGIPWRYAIRCVDELGLILRAEVIWSKPNGLPESITDRVRRSHEHWFHFTKAQRYYSCLDAVREEYAAGTAAKYAKGFSPDSTSAGRERLSTNVDYSGTLTPNPLGKLPGSVWTIPTQPLQVPASLGVDHFAAFPMEWPRRIIKGWSPSGICVDCGEGRRAVSQTTLTADRGGRKANIRVEGVVYDDTTTLGRERVVTITGEACACLTSSAPTRPAVVLDPFGGTGTTALVASSLGRTGISCDLSHDYSRLARWRTTDPGQRAAAMQVEKPKVEMPGQADLFGDVA